MTTKNPRINVTFTKETSQLLAYLAKEENTSVAGLTRKLTLESLERREDMLLSDLVQKLDKKGAKTVSHKSAWK